MGDATTARPLATILSGGNRVIYSFTNLSDGVGESGVTKVDISELPGAPTQVFISRIWYSISGMQVRVLFDHSTDDTVLLLAGTGYQDFSSLGGITDPASGGGTGDILFTTVGQVANDSYSIVLEVAWN